MKESESVNAKRDQKIQQGLLELKAWRETYQGCPGFERLEEISRQIDVLELLLASKSPN